ncbi:MAG TPA: periplasmic heavy metal sensor [Verrucomicrobiae bacterium]|jgi:Spy/CpxP family protein refolding chaperone|nr:periplasmic heavy metal sensor [Verrucomicrobiae bacterium]
MRWTSSRRAAQAGLAMALMLGTALLGSVPPAFAQMRPERGGWGRDGGTALPLLIRAAKLTPEQDEKVRAILTNHRTVSRNTVEQLRRAQDELADKLLGAAPVQVADLQPLLKQIAALREQLLQDSAQIALEVRSVLTPEQLERAGQVRGRMKQLQSEMQQIYDR